MHKLVYRGNDQFDIVSVSIPQPGPNEVVVKMKVAALCGSDIHIKEQHDLEFLKNRDYSPKTPSHEPAGIVTQIGTAVNTVQIGDRVAVYHKLGCQACDECRTGNIVMCAKGGALSSEFDGAAADYLVVPRENCLPLPESLGFEDGAIMMCAGGTAYSGLSKLKLNSGESLAVFGCGPVGLATIILAKAMGAHVFAVDIHPDRLALATKVGADFVINSSKDVPVQNVYDMIHGFTVPASSTVEKLYGFTNGKGVDCVAECSASSHARANGVDSLARRGRMVLLGIDNQFRNNFSFQRSLEPEKIIFKELSIFGSNVFPLPMFYPMVKFMTHNRVSFVPMITHRFPLEQGAAAFKMAATPSSGKVIITWDN